MKVLIADDDRVIRLTLKRILSRLGCSSIEVADGADVLDVVRKTPVELVCLDLGMPTMNGLEVLQALRGSSSHAELPVVVITGENDQQSATDAIALGAKDFIIKPLHVNVVLNRLKRVVDSVRRGGNDHPVAAAPPVTPIRVLVADPDRAFRQFVAATLAPHTVDEAPTAQRAFKACRAERPDVVLVGENIGKFGAAFYARRLRGLAQLASTRFVLLADGDTVLDRAAHVVFDAVIGRTDSRPTFRRQFDQMLHRDERVAPLPDLVGGFRRTFINAMEQAVETMASTEIHALVDAPRNGRTDVVIGVTLDLPTSRAAIDMEIACPMASAKRLAARMIDESEFKVTQEDAVSAVVELANVVAGRMRTVMTSSGESARCTMPKITPHGRALANADLQFTFGSAMNNITLWLAVSARRTELSKAS
jgi:DNA-binding response OmpR family regulator/CheY-specific phosphatase CheX